MKIRTLAIYFAAAALICLVSSVSAKADVIDLESLLGPSTFGAATPQTLTFATSSGTLTINGGSVLTNTTFLPADETTVYGTTNCCGNLSTITLTFASPINNFFFDLINGQVVPETFIVSDNLGNSQVFPNVPSNGNLGVALVSFATVGNVITITTSDPNWDFFIDNIGFNQPTPGVPEPGSLALLGLGILGLAAVKLSKR